MTDGTEQSSAVRHGVLFDVDGTLVDSNYQHTLAWWQAFRRLGHDVPMAEIHRAIGMGGDKLIAHLLGEDRDEEQDSELDSTHGAVYSTYYAGLRAFEGAADLLRRCAENSKPSPDILEAALKAGGLEAANTVFVGDSVWDVIATAELKIPTIRLSSGGTSEVELREAVAVEVYKDIKALQKAFDDGALHHLATP